MPERLKPYFPSAMLLLLIAYLGVQALTGERGLLSGGARDAMLVRRDVAVWLSADSPRTLINAYLKPAAMAGSKGALIAMLLHIYGLHVQQRQGQKPLPWITPVEFD